MYTDVGVDDGDMILQQEECIRPEDTAESLLGRLSCIAAELMVQTLALVEKGQAPRTPQDEQLATRQPMLSNKMGPWIFHRGQRQWAIVPEGLRHGQARLLP